MVISDVIITISDVITIISDSKVKKNVERKKSEVNFLLEYATGV